MRPLRRPSGVELGAIAASLLPWTWYLVRNRDPRLDVVALGWPLFGVAISALCWGVTVLGRRWTSAAVALSWTMCTLAVVVAPWRPHDPGPVRASGRVRIAAANVLGDHTYPPGVLRQVDAQHPDVLVVSELSGNARPTYAAAFPFVITEPVDQEQSVGVFSRYRLHDLGLPPALRSQRGHRVRVDAPGGPFVLYALHLQKPGPNPSSVEVGFRTHKHLIDAVVRSVRAETLPVVVAGDLNLVDRSSGYRELTDVLDDAMHAGWVGPTSLKRSTKPLLARIDHIFEPPSWCADDAHTFTIRGSDHRGVVTTIGPCR